MASFHESPEKAQAFSAATTDINEVNEALEGYVLDPSNPLNWSPRKKTLILIIIAYIAWLADYVGGTAILTIIPQSVYVFRSLQVVGTLSANTIIEGMAHDPTPRPACCRGKYLHDRVGFQVLLTADWEKLHAIPV